MTLLNRCSWLFSFFFLSGTILAEEHWQGYINDKTLRDEPYGYLFHSNAASDTKKIRMICQPSETFILYLLKTEKPRPDMSTVQLSVDSLPAMEFTVKQMGSSLAISNSAEDFWQLLAQMVAGVELQVSWPGVKPKFTYSLRGFTDTYTRVCGWVSSSNQYQPHLERYR